MSKDETARGQARVRPAPEPTDRPPEPLAMPDADVLFYPAFFGTADSDTFYQALLEGTDWQQEQINLYGRLIDVPRLTAWHGDAGKSYRYSGITVDPAPWTPTLLVIR